MLFKATYKKDMRDVVVYDIFYDNDSKRPYFLIYHNALWKIESADLFVVDNRI